MRDFLVEDHEQAFGDAERHVFDVAEPTRERTDCIGRVYGEGSLKDVKSEGASVGQYHPWLSAPFWVFDRVRQYLLLQPAEDAILGRERSTIGPVVSWSTAKRLVKL